MELKHTNIHVCVGGGGGHAIVSIVPYYGLPLQLQGSI